MLEYDRINISEEIDVDKTNTSKECDICHYQCLSNKGFQFEPYVSNGCHDFMQKAMNFNDVSIVFVKGSDYRILFWYMKKDDAISIMKSPNSNENIGLL